MNNKKIIDLPKIDLHCHLDGSLTLQTVRKLLGKDIKLELLQVTDDCKNLAEYLEKFELPLQCLQTEIGLETAAYELIEDVAKENIVYIEVRFAPLLSVNPFLSCEKVIEAVLRGLNRGREDFNVYSNAILCAMRHHSEDANISMIKIARAYLGQGVGAVDLAGNEAAYPMKGFRELFLQVNKWEMPFTIHAGECGSVENVIEAVACGAKRIGHGIALKDHVEAQKICKDKSIGIEMCPISNLQTKAVTKIEEYPLNQFLENELCVTINTDNRMVSNTSITKEIQTIQSYWKQTDESVIKLMRNAVEISFATDLEKHSLLKYFL